MPSNNLGMIDAPYAKAVASSRPTLVYFVLIFCPWLRWIAVLFSRELFAIYTTDYGASGRIWLMYSAETNGKLRAVEDWRIISAPHYEELGINALTYPLVDPVWYWLHATRGKTPRWVMIIYIHRRSKINHQRNHARSQWQFLKGDGKGIFRQIILGRDGSYLRCYA